MKDMILGVDIGGTKIRAVLLSERRVIKFCEYKTPSDIHALKVILTQLTEYLINSPLSRIGIGAAGIINGNLLMKSPNIKYIKKFNFNRLFSDVSHCLQTNFQIKTDNDARCFLRAEINAMPHLSKGRILGITLGTGVGRAIAKNGKVLRIKKFEYPEKWEDEYQKMKDRKNDEATVDFLVKKLMPIIRQYAPSAVVIGGGVARRKNFIKKFRHSAKCRNSNIKIIRTKLGKNSVALGAVLLYKNQKIS